MFRINTETETYNLVANVVSTFIGIGAASLVGTFCNNIITNNVGSDGETTRMKLGRTGFKVITLNTVSNEMRKNLDDMAHGWNAIVDILEGVESATPVDPEVVVEG